MIWEIKFGNWIKENVAENLMHETSYFYRCGWINRTRARHLMHRHFTFSTCWNYALRKLMINSDSDELRLFPGKLSIKIHCMRLLNDAANTGQFCWGVYCLWLLWKNSHSRMLLLCSTFGIFIFEQNNNTIFHWTIVTYYRNYSNSPIVQTKSYQFTN